MFSKVSYVIIGQYDFDTHCLYPEHQFFAFLYEWLWFNYISEGCTFNGQEYEPGKRLRENCNVW